MSAAISAVTARSFVFKIRCSIISELIDKSLGLDPQILLYHASLPLLDSTTNVIMDDWKMIEFLVRGFADEGKGHDPGTIAQLMKYGVDVYNIDGNGSTILHTLSNRELLAYILDTENIEIDKKDGQGCTAILVAAKVKAFDRVAVFLDAKANVNVTDNDGSTLLHHCVKDEGIMGQILHENKVDVNTKNQFGHTAVYNAINIETYGTVKRLLDAGACPGVRDLQKAIKVEAYECIEDLLRHSGHSNKTQLLGYSIATGKEKMFDLFLSKDTMIEPTKTDWDRLLKTAVGQGKIWFVYRIVNHHKITIDPAWLGPLVCTASTSNHPGFESCEALRQCLNIIKADMNGKLPKADLIPLQLARERNRHDMAYLMEAFLRNAPLTKVITKEEHIRLIMSGRKQGYTN